MQTRKSSIKEDNLKSFYHLNDEAFERAFRRASSFDDSFIEPPNHNASFITRFNKGKKVDAH